MWVYVLKRDKSGGLKRDRSFGKNLGEILAFTFSPLGWFTARTLVCAVYSISMRTLECELPSLILFVVEMHATELHWIAR